LNKLTEVSIKNGYRATSNHYRKLVYPLFVILLILLLTAPVQAKYSGGTGEPNNPYQIADANDMNEIGVDPNDWDKHFVMVNDINLSGIVYSRAVIAPDTNNSTNGFQGDMFEGVFDGNGHTISNFTCESVDVDYVGLFGAVNDVNAQIMGLRMVDPNIDAGSGSSAGRTIGCLVANLESGTISNCIIEGCSVLGAEPLGGMVGRSISGLITDCYAQGSVIGTYVSDDVGILVGLSWHGDVINCSSAGFAQGRWDVGGLVGNLSYGIMKNCYSQADANGEGAVGSLIGHHYYSVTTNSWSSGNASGLYGIGGLLGENVYSTASDCYATGIVDGNEKVGGLAGYNKGDLLNSYSVGRVTGTYYVGGLCGLNYYIGSITGCYSTGSVTGDTYVGGLCGYQKYNDCIMSNCFWDVEASGHSVGYNLYSAEPGTVENVFGKTTAEMKIESTFADAGWDFVEIWNIGENQTYPFLRQYPAGDLNHDGVVNLPDFAILADHWLAGVE
jgi:hypothetical protein